MSRVIRLKEWGCNQKTFKRPSEKQISVATSGLEDKDYALNTDSNGFIINSLLSNREERNKSIVLLGDSFVESLFVDENKRLNAVIEDLASDVCVLNAGYSGATSLHLINILINKVVPFSPDYVVVFVPTNDQRIQSLENGYWNKDLRLSPLVTLGKQSTLSDDYKNKTRLKSVEKALKTIHFLLDNYHIPHCFVSTPHRHAIGNCDKWLNKVGIDSQRYSRKIKQRKEVNLTCRKFCKKYYIDFIDLERQIDDSEFFYDDLHLTSESSLLVGKVLYKNLGDLGVF